MSGSELYIPVRNGFGELDDPTMERSLRRCFRAIEDWSQSPFVSSAHIQNAAITNAHIADATIDAAKITNLSADKITSGTLNAEILLASKMRTGDIGQRRVEMDNAGVRLLDSSDATVVNLPTDVDQPAYFAGTVVASDLQLSGAATVSDDLTVDINGGTVRVAAALGNATTAPAVNASGVPSSTFHVGSGTASSSYTARRGLWFDGTYYRYLASNNTFYTVQTSGTLLTTAGYNAGSAYYNSGCYIASTDKWYFYSAAFGDVTVFSSTIGAGGSKQPTGTPIVSHHIHSGTASTPPSYVGYITTDGTNLFYAQPGTLGVVAVSRYTVSGTSVTFADGVTCDTGLGDQSGWMVTSFYRGNGDLGATRNIFGVILGTTTNVYTQTRTPTHFYVFNTSGVRQTAEEWDGVGGSGLTYRTANFYEIPSAQEIIYQFAPVTSSFASATYWVAYTWYDSDTTGLTHESSLSPRAPFTGGKRRQLQITWPTIPDAGGTDDPNSVRIYLKQATSDPGSAFGSYFRQGSTYTGTTTTLTSYNTGTAGVQDTAFPNSGSPGQITTGLGSFVVKGDGTMILPTFTSDPGSPTNGQIYYNSTSGKARVYNGIWNDLY